MYIKKEVFIINDLKKDGVEADILNDIFQILFNNNFTPYEVAELIDDIFLDIQNPVLKQKTKNFLKTIQNLITDF